MPKVTLVYGEKTKTLRVEAGSVLGSVVASTDLPLEQPCAGRGTCGLCKVLDEGGLAPPDEVELKHLTEGELAIGNRLACRARIQDNARVVLTPIVVYSNKIFRGSDRYKRARQVPLGLAIDLGSTTVAAFLTMMDTGEVCAGAASLNQQGVYGADVISRLAAACNDKTDKNRLHRLAVASINHAIDSLKLSDRIRSRIVNATIVGNPAMHHLLANLPLGTLAIMPFQPYATDPILDAADLLGGILPSQVKVSLPPLIGGFVGSDALACLAYFDFENANRPMAAIDLGTNGEVMVTDGKRILVASTAAGPAFEGVNISCGSRAVDGAITKVTLVGTEVSFETIGDDEMVGLTGSGLLSAVHEFRRADIIAANGRINPHAPLVQDDNSAGRKTRKAIYLTADGRLKLRQMDIRELQKAKGAIRAAIDVLMQRLDLRPEDLDDLILTGSFGGQVDIDAILALGMIPPVNREVVKAIPNGAGFGAAQFLTADGFARGVNLAAEAEQVDLDLDPDFFNRFIYGMSLTP
jgi:uncharacterized 2Fe-2S/4Fe-4S cluster protein (DUF4445 family)